MNPPKATKILVLGAGGMIGHKMYQLLANRFPETYACIRKPYELVKNIGIFDPDHTLDRVDVLEFGEIEKILRNLNPDVTLNCVGITLRKEKINDLNYCLEVNSLFPHRLKSWAERNSARLIQFSTDCVFDGVEGSYTEWSRPSAKDVYGRTKYLGEIYAPHCLTLRGSVIGRELFGKTELLEWVLSKKGGTVGGFSRAIYSGVSAPTLAEIVENIILNRSHLHGLYQYSSTPISKYELILKLNAGFNLGLNVEKDDGYSTKKDLLSGELTKATGFVCPHWDTMIERLAHDKTNYS